MGNYGVINGYAAGAAIIRSLVERGDNAIHINTLADLPSYYKDKFDSSLYIDCLNPPFTSERIADVLKHRGVRHVFAGMDSGIALSDQLNSLLGLIGNTPKTSHYRFDKLSALRRLSACNVPHTRFFDDQGDEELSSWFVRLPSPRTVVKPRTGSGSDRVFFCNTLVDIQDAVIEINDSLSSIGHGSHEPFIQSYIQGTEYIVNTVSAHGEHFVSDVWEYAHLSANGKNDITDSVFLLPYDAIAHKVLTDYAFDVLRALDVQFGAAHLEIRQTLSGPILIEANCRLAGGNLQKLAKDALGVNQLDDLYLAINNSLEFAKRGPEKRDLRYYISVVGLLSPYSGKLSSYHHLSKIMDLQSFWYVDYNVNIGDQISRTVDDYTYPLIVHLRHEDPSQLRRDQLSIRYLDGCSFYNVE